MISQQQWRDAEPKAFDDAVTIAARQLGVLPLAVEKDYWACEILRAITVAHPGEVVFKGGTSLEKLRIIRRFSEDLDLLVIGTYESNRAAERALMSMMGPQPRLHTDRRVAGATEASRALFTAVPTWRRRWRIRARGGRSLMPLRFWSNSGSLGDPTRTAIAQ